MCLAIPGKILKINGQIAEVDFNGVHAGFAIEKMEREQADYINSVVRK